MGKKSRRRQKKNNRPMIWMAGAGVLLLLGALFLVLQGQKGDLSLVEVKGQPAIKVDQELIDYGDVNFGVNKKFEILVTNVGDKPLRFTKQPYVEVAEGC